MKDLHIGCTFTGHRDLSDEVDVNLLVKCIKNLIERGVDTFYCGMAKGFDLLAADAVLSLKGEFEGINLIACVPCPSQDKYFSADVREHYSSILQQCDEVKVLSQNYYNGCMYARDRYMVDNSDYVVAYLREKNGGTFYTVSYAKSRGKTIVIL